MKKFINKILFFLNIIAGTALLISYLSTYFSPSKIWVLAFFGLAFPYFLLANLIFFLFYLYRRKRKLLFSLIIILAGFNHLNSFFPIRVSKLFSKSTPQKNTEEVKLLSYNVNASNIFDWYSNPKTSRLIAQLIRSELPDLICIQEYYVSPYSKYKSSTIFELFANTPYHYIYPTPINSSYSGYGIATFSKFPIVNKGVISFPGTVNKSIYADVVINNDTIRVYNNHLQSVSFHKKNMAFLDTLKLHYNEEDLHEILDISIKLKTAFIRRSIQVDSISAHIKNCPYPVLVCGDFNDTPVSYTYKKMTKGLKDAFISSGKGVGKTYHGLFPSFRIDFILHSKEFNPLNFDRLKIHLSDHYPIMCTFELKNSDV